MDQGEGGVGSRLFWKNVTETSRWGVWRELSVTWFLSLPLYYSVQKPPQVLRLRHTNLIFHTWVHSSHICDGKLFICIQSKWMTIYAFFYHTHARGYIRKLLLPQLLTVCEVCANDLSNSLKGELNTCTKGLKNT